MPAPRVAIVGGGISGLATAYYLLKLQKEAGKNIEIALYEAQDRLGGTIETENTDGFILEKGPDAFITDKPWALNLSKELGLENELIGTNPTNRRSFIARNGKLLSVPEGFYLVAPIDIGAFLRSPIVSLPGKLRMMAELFLPKKENNSDESIASFVRRRFGREALDRVAQAMLGGIYTGDPEALSLRATMPRFLELEQKYGSVTRGLMIETRHQKAAVSGASGPRYSLFSSFKNGMRTLPETLAKNIPANSIFTKSEVKKISYDKNTQKWALDFQGRNKELFDSVCIASTAKQAAFFLKEEAPKSAEKLSKISYESVATVNLAYKAEQLSHPLNGFGFVTPKIENKAVIACSFSNRKFEGRAPKGYALLRAFVGGAFGRHHFEKNDQEIISQSKSELQEYLGIQGEPVLTRLQRHPKAMVQYAVGHLDLVSEIRVLVSKSKGLFLTGSSYGGAGIPDCIREAESEAKKIFESVIN